MVDLKILNQFMLTISPANTHSSINVLFQNVAGEPTACAAQGLNGMKQFVGHKDLETQAAAVNGILTGIFIAHASTMDEFRNVLVGYIELVKRSKGEHVVDFNQYRAKKGH